MSEDWATNERAMSTWYGKVLRVTDQGAPCIEDMTFTSAARDSTWVCVVLLFRLLMGLRGFALQDADGYVLFSLDLVPVIHRQGVTMETGALSLGS